VKVHCVFAGIKQPYQLAFDHFNKTDFCVNLTVDALRDLRSGWNAKVNVE